MATLSSSSLLEDAQCPAPSLNQRPKIELGINGLPNDIYYLIASELLKTSPSTMLALGQSSRILRQATAPFLNRNLVLKKNSSKDGLGVEEYLEIEACEPSISYPVSRPVSRRPKRAYDALIESFRNDHNYEIAKHVRSLTIKDDLATSDLLLILDKISSSGTLRKLSWETPAHMPGAVLDKLQATWPDLELSVRVLNRQNALNPKHRQMDTELLSSPLLKSLAYNVFHQCQNSEDPARSEWPRLTQALVTGGHVRVLQIQALTDSRYSRGGEILNKPDRERLTRLYIDNETQFPALEEMTLRTLDDWGRSTYLWDSDHCERLCRAMDMSRLSKLDFGSEMPNVFFSFFTGQLPQLKALRFGIPWNGASMAPVKRFIDSIEGLESLDIDRAQSAIDDLWPTIINHRVTLKELILRPAKTEYCSPQYIPLDRLETIAAEFPMLERLGWDAPCQSDIDAKHLGVLGTLKLQHLHLFLHIPGAASAYSEKLIQDAMGTISPPRIDREGSKAAAIAIMETIFEAQGKPLEILTLHLARTGYEDRAQPYIMHGNMQLRRAADGKYTLRGKQAWSWGAQFEEELLFSD